MKLLHKHNILLLIGLLMLVFAFNTKLGTLAFTIFFQILIVLGMIEQIRQYLKIKKGPYVDGELTGLRKIPGIEEEAHNFEASIDFIFPGDGTKYQIKHKFSALSKPVLGKRYKIWIDESDPAKSIATNDFGAYWKYTIIFFGIVFIGLFVLDFILIKQLMSLYRCLATVTMFYIEDSSLF